MRTRRSVPLRGLALTLVIVAVGLVGCGSDDSGEANGPTTTAGTADTAAADEGKPGPPPEDAVDLTGQAEVAVAVGDNEYTERTIVVSPGTDVTWINEGLNRHNVIASVPDSFKDIETVDLDDGGSATRTFDSAGEYAYYCSKRCRSRPRTSSSAAWTVTRSSSTVSSTRTTATASRSSPTVWPSRT